MAMSICDFLNREVPMEEDFCFVIMPFDGKLDEVYHRRIMPIMEEFGFRCRRADQNLGSTIVLLEIIDDILKAKVIIADLTDANPNVYYELGICHAIGKYVILLNSKGSEVPFNISGLHYFEYGDQPGGESVLRDFLKGALLLQKDKGEAELFDKRALARNLKKSCHLWKSGQEVLIDLDDFLEIVLGLDFLSPTDEEISFLCQAAAYYGKFMKRMTDTANMNKAAIHVLAVEAANGSYTRVPWRAASMLENLNRSLVERELRDFTGEIRNQHIFPGSILEGSTVSLLARTVNDPKTPQNVREKLTEALGQIKAEFKGEEEA